MKFYEHGGAIFKAARAHGVSITELDDFSANINPLVNVSILKAWAEPYWSSILHYPDTDYLDLRLAIAQFHNIDIENIILGNGATALISEIVKVIKPKRARISAPTFGEYEKALYAVKAQVDIVEVESDLTLSLTSFFSSIDATDLIFLCTPNNPTGLMCNPNQLLMHLKQLPENTVCIIDEAFIDFTVEGEYNSLISQVETLKNVIILRSATKFFGIPGLRLGYAISSNLSLNKAIKNAKIVWDINAMASGVVISALKDKAFHDRTRQYILEQRLSLQSALTAMGVRCYDSSTNYFLIQLPEGLNWYQQLYNRKILIRKCENYKGLKGVFYRIAVKDFDANQRLIKAILDIKERNVNV